MVHELAELPRILMALCEAGLALGKGGEPFAAPHLGPAASQLLAGAACAVQLMGQPTVAAGLQKLRAEGRPLPEHLARSVRALDSAAAFLRHLCALDLLLGKLRDHQAQDCKESEGGRPLRESRSARL